MNRTAIAVIGAMTAVAAYPGSWVGGFVQVAEKKGMAGDPQDYDEGEEPPFAEGRNFATLDEYLEFLRERGAYDVPWFQEIRPGVYALISRRGPNAPPIVYTREQLMERFGFTR